MKPLSAHILAIGSELLHGGRIESNSPFIAEVLACCGIEVRKKISLGDDPSDIASSLVNSAGETDVIVTTGGLGSTVDDCTRESVAKAFDLRLTVRYKALRLLTGRLRSRGREITPLIARQAMIPVGAKILENSVGTAPGFFLRAGRTLIFVLPGVPREAREMMGLQVRPILQKYSGRTHRTRWSQSFNTFGIPETDLQQLLSVSIQRYRLFQFSFLPTVQGVTVTLSQWQTPRTARRLPVSRMNGPDVVSLVDEVRSILSPWLFSEGGERMEEIVGKLLMGRRWTLAVAESCTGGLITHRLTEVPGSSAFLDRGIVSYSNDAKQKLLGVPSQTLTRFGAVSLQVAQAMARGIRRRSGVDLGVGITGIAGPGGGSKTKPVGMVCIAVEGPHGLQAKQFQFWGDRTEIKYRSSQAALDLVRRYVQLQGGR